MKAWKGLTVGLALVPLTPWLANHALATTVSGSASTVLEWYDDASGDTVVPIYQYLRLNAADLNGSGYDFRVYGRVGDDLANEHESWADGRLYYAYLEKKGFLAEPLDMRLGRQFVATAAGASLLDGLRLDYAFLDRYRASVFGGGDVTYYEGYNTKDATFGWEVGGPMLTDDLDLALSYLGKWDDGLLSHELFGLNAEYNWRDSLYLYNETQYDYLSDRISYFLGGFKIHPVAAWTGRLEYLYSLPVFASTSIYSVFAVDEYREIMAEITRDFSRGIRGFGRYTREIYEEFADANVLEVGVEKMRTDGIAGYLSGVYRSDGDGQDQRGIKAHADYRFNETVQAGLGLELDVLERRINYFDLDSEPDETTSSRIWADATVFMTEKINVQAKVERIESDLWDHYNRGRVRLNILF